MTAERSARANTSANVNERPKLASVRVTGNNRLWVDAGAGVSALPSHEPCCATAGMTAYEILSVTRSSEGATRDSCRWTGTIDANST
jgi:hypothetical protein